MANANAVGLLAGAQIQMQIYTATDTVALSTFQNSPSSVWHTI